MAGAGQAGCGPMTGTLDCYRFVSPISTDNALVLTEPIKSRMGGFVQTAFWEVRSEPFGS